MLKMIKSALTGPDGETFDEIKIAFVVFCATFIAFTADQVLVERKPFDSGGFVEGFAGLVAATGLTSSAKQLAKAMPPAKQPEPKDPQ